MIVVGFFLDALPKRTSYSLILNFIEAILWYQIYHIEWNIQRVRCNLPSSSLAMKTMGIIIDVEGQWAFAIPRFIVKYPWITQFIDKIRHSLKAFPVLKETLNRIEKGGRWFVVSGHTPRIYHKPEYLELVYKIHSIEYLIWLLEILMEIEKEDHIKHEKAKAWKEMSSDKPKHRRRSQTSLAYVHAKPLKESAGLRSKSIHHRSHSMNDTPILNQEASNDLTQAEPLAQDESLLPPENIKVASALSPHIDMIIDELIKDINWCGDELDENKNANFIQAGLNIIEHINPWRCSSRAKQQYRRVDVLSIAEKNELMKRLTVITDYLINLFPDINAS